MTEQDSPPDADAPADPMAELRARAEALERKLSALQQEAETRLALSELKAEALRAGIVDLDGLRFIDLSKVKLAQDGVVEGGAGLIAALRRAKPWLFAGTSSSATAQPPPAQPPRQKLATEMTDDEYRAARAALLKRRG